MKKIILSLSIILFGFCASAQYSYNKVITTENVELSYKWRNTKLFDTSSPLDLALKLKNSNDSAVMVNFSVQYYMDGILDGTTQIDDFCIKKNRTARGEYNGLILKSEGKTEEVVTSEGFKLEFSDLNIRKVASCESKN
tara:strand:+ start:1569 stop:1985 length:417 start_codon:yes stop_codon:yes gene_type:complete